MRCSIPAPSARDGKKNFRRLGDKLRLHFRRQHQVAISLSLRRERCEDSPTHAKVRRAHMRALFGAGETERYPSKIIGGHGDAI